ncbi:FkbM family methyltransferase [Sphingomonas sp. H39-1-10]|uniref:FkbM family methyltransferase n=1 Tax=Sphingomonas pollutisoli TaxID=3030829 RepID=UPI0023B9F3AC|nr:FkbM family methyltransferase [Sphingomonas pollutisoli]MDF0490487.1 FkbM family methyltransferase [Sphingomonas pollutisoli]
MAEPDASTRARDSAAAPAAGELRIVESRADRPAAPSAFELYKAARLGFSEKATLDDLWNCYRLFLRRAPDETGFNSRAKLVQKGVTVAELTKPFIASREFNTLDKGKAAPRTARIEVDGLVLHAPAPPADQPADAGETASRAHLRGMIASLLMPGQFILDIGAGIGEFAIHAARRIGPSGRVVALEPAPQLMRLLIANSLAHEAANIDILPFAAADGEGFVSLIQRGQRLTFADVAQADLLGETDAQIVYARTIDSIVPETQKVDIVRIALAGFEFRALSGAASLLKAHRPAIIGDYAPRQLEQYSGVPGEAYLRFLKACGYSSFVAIPRRDRALDLGDDIAALAGLPARMGIGAIDFLAT